MTREEEYELIARSQDGDAKATDALLSSYRYFALGLATKLFDCKSYDKRSEVQSSALEGLYIAITRFDASKGFRLTTYATAWIRNKVINKLAYLHEDDDLENIDTWADDLCDPELTAEDDRQDLISDIRYQIINCKSLKPKEAQYARLRWVDGLTMAGCAIEMGVTRQRCQQMDGVVLAKLSSVIAV